MCKRLFQNTCFFLCHLLASQGFAEVLLYRYEGDVPPYDQAAGWIVVHPCNSPCTESVENGRFVLRWPVAGTRARYHLWIATPDTGPPPPSLWVEWRFRSNHPLGPNFVSCDADFTIKYGGMLELVNMYGDAAISFNGNDFVTGLAIEEFHTYRFESLDAVNYRIAVDGRLFIARAMDNPNGYHALQMGGFGGCFSDQLPDKFNEWDFVRYGTISFGEQIFATAPSKGFLDARRQAGLDRFTVTYDSPNYVYIDEISVETTDGPPPEVIATRRLDNGEPDTVQIVLDRPVPMHGTTRFTFDDGEAVNVVEYTFAPGDTNGNGRVDLFDAASFQNCFGLAVDEPTICAPLDLNRNGTIGPLDFKMLVPLLSGP